MGKDLERMINQLKISMLEGFVNAFVVFLIGYIVLGVNETALEYSMILGLFRFTVSLRELEWVSMKLDGLPEVTGSRDKRMVRAFMNIGKFI